MTDIATTTTYPAVLCAARHFWLAAWRWHQARLTRKELSNLPDYMLRDIGIRPDAIEGVTWASVDALLQHRLR